MLLGLSASPMGKEKFSLCTLSERKQVDNFSLSRMFVYKDTCQIQGNFTNFTKLY